MRMLNANMDSEQAQLEHYDRIIGDYESHYDDACSQAYRRRFLYDPMFEGIDLSNCRVLEGMCGTGQMTEYLQLKRATVVGLDISRQAMTLFRQRWPNAEAICGSIRDTKLESASFDCVVVLGGLHHVHPNVESVVDEIYRLLKDGGYFCFGEPHKGSLPDVVRRAWYRLDRKMFAEGEMAIDIDDLRNRNCERFQFVRERYVGHVAYLLVLNSMIFRIPVRLKRYYAPVLSAIESWTSRLESKTFSCFAVCQWRKLPTKQSSGG